MLSRASYLDRVTGFGAFSINRAIAARHGRWFRVMVTKISIKTLLPSQIGTPSVPRGPVTNPRSSTVERFRARESASSDTRAVPRNVFSITKSFRPGVERYFCSKMASFASARSGPVAYRRSIENHAIREFQPSPRPWPPCSRSGYNKLDSLRVLFREHDTDEETRSEPVPCCFENGCSNIRITLFDAFLFLLFGMT